MPLELARPKMAQVIADGLRADIASGKLANGRRLPLEHELIAEYGVSRAVVREALRLLESSGLVVVRRGPKGGAVVTHRTSGVVRDTLLLSLQLADARLGQVYDCLLAVLPGAARLAAEHRPTETGRALRDYTAAEAEERVTLNRFNQAIQGFNHVMLANCGNHALQLFASSLLEILREVTQPAIPLIQHKLSEDELRGGYFDMLHYHEHLAAAIEGGNGAHADAAWRRYIENVGTRFFQLIPRNFELADSVRWRRDDRMFTR